jgi:hypothetical protein
MRKSLKLIVYILLIGAFAGAVFSMSKRDEKREQETLLKAVERDISAYYAMEGYYPEDVSELEERYGLSYDKDKYFIGYEIYGTNIRPYVTIVNLRDEYE